MTDVAVAIADGLARVREAIDAAARTAGRDPQSIRLVAVAKTKPAELVRAAIAAGARIIGENYVQEASAKIAAVGRQVSWHFIGHLQRNKAREAAGLFELIQTLDNLRLAGALDRIGRERGAAVRTLVEVNIGGETSKRGIAPQALEPFLQGLAAFSGLRVEGLMTIPPPGTASQTRQFFRRLRELRDQLRRSTPPNVELRDLSMGMSDDYTDAVAEGATIVRVGRAIFGERS